MHALSQKPRQAGRAQAVGLGRTPSGQANATRASSIAHLQRSIGNQAVKRLLQPAVHPATLLSRVVPADATHERDAVRFANAVNHPLASSGGLRNLPQLRVHATGPASHAADVLGARAFAFGSTVAFAPGEFRPDTIDG